MSNIVKNDALVTLSVRMFDLQDHLLDETHEEGMTYLHGHGDIFPRIEEVLEGHFQGEGFSVTLEPEEAFGEYDPEAIVMLDLELLGDADSIVPGLMFESVPGQHPDGRIWRVTDVADGKVVLEANHPLAGYTLKFEIKILKVEDAPEDEEGVIGNDSVVVPSFLQLADRICREEEDDEQQEVSDVTPDDSAISKMATTRIIH